LKTSKPFATISYNTPNFLFLKLSDLVNKGKLSWFAFVYHYKEEDEKKDHIHVFFIPDGQIDTKPLGDLLREFDPTHPDQPLGVLPFQSSKFPDWYLYSSHNTEYLASKGQSRKYHYEKSDFKTSNEDYLTELEHLIDRSKINNITVVREAVENNVPFSSLVKEGRIPVQLINQYQKVYDLIEYNNAIRNGKTTHTPIVDPDTGEVLNSKLLQHSVVTDEELPDFPER